MRRSISIEDIAQAAGVSHATVSRALRDSARISLPVRERVQREAEAIYSKDLVELIFMQPYTKIGFLVDAGIAKRQTASRYLQTLATMGILREEQVGREKYYINDALFAELTR